MISLLASDAAEHRARIGDWLKLPHVSRWWGDASECLAKFDATPSYQHAIIARDGIPIGYVRWETVSREALDAVGLTGIPDGSIDIDIFIGPPEETGRGVGPRALDLIFDRLRATTDAPLAGLCSSIDNHHAHAAFLKAGCTRLTDFDDPDFGPCIVFARRLR